MKNKLAGHLPLQDMIVSVIERARGSVQEKTASAKAEEKKVEEVVTEKVAGLAIDINDNEEVEKLASALDFASEQLVTKEADAVVNGSESKQGGQQLPVQSPSPGTQPVPAGKATAKNQPKTGLESPKDNPGPANAIKTDVAGRSAKGTQKVAGVENGGESAQGGQQLSNSATPPSLPGKSLIQSPEAITNATRREAKAQPKKEMKAYISEPALSKAHDKVVHQALRNADKGGVKIAEARAALEKIASEGCKCEKSGTCQHCKLKKAAAEMAPQTKETSQE